MGESPESVSKKFIHEYFPNCKIALLAGSAFRKELTMESDLDLVIIDETQQSSYRECFFYFDWKIEAFVFNNHSLDFSFELGCLEGLPIQRMCIECIILKDDDGTAIQLQQEAKECMDSGPSERTEIEINYARFMITDLVDDLNGSNNRNEQLFIANKLFDLVNEFILRVNGQWIGHGKWMFRSLLDFDQLWCEEWIKVFEEYINTRKLELLNRCIDQLLQPYGGRLFVGYKEELF